MTNSIVQQNKERVWEFWQSVNHTPRKITKLTREYVDEHVLWQGPHPLNKIEGRQALIEEFWQPLLHAFPDLQRRAYLFIGGEVGSDVTGEDEVQYWVCGMGDYIATFANDWLGIPASGQSVHIRFGEYNRVLDDKIVETYTLIDLVSLMQQAGFAVLPPSPGADIWVPGPIAGNGVLLGPQDDIESQKTIELLNDMLFKGMKYDQPDPDSPSMDGYWTDDMVWYGPSGIGSGFGLEEFYAFVQGPIVAGHPDRIGGFHKARLAEGHCACMGGRRALQGTHTGEFLGMAPSGNRVEWRIMDFFTRQGGRLHEDWVLVDLVHACLQCGHDLFERMEVVKSEERKSA